MGVDCQLVDLTHALVIAAAARQPDERAARLVADAIGAAALFGGCEAPDVSRYTVRGWRVMHLRRLLDPKSGATPDAKTEIRRYARALETLVLSRD
jgi:hypothetical protein